MSLTIKLLQDDIDGASKKVKENFKSINSFIDHVNDDKLQKIKVLIKNLEYDKQIKDKKRRKKAEYKKFVD